MNIEGRGAQFFRSFAQGVPDFRFMEATNADLKIRGLTFVNGSILHQSGLGGGALLAIGGSLVLEKTNFVGNKALSFFGGALSIIQTDSKVRDSRFFDNQLDVGFLNGAGAGGGAIGIRDSTVLLSDAHSSRTKR